MCIRDRGKIDACSYARFQEMTGLTLDEADGTMKENLPPIQQFLNRCLALRIDMQDAIFEAFGGFLSAIIEDARQAGTLDVGLETLRAEKFEIVDRKVIFEHEATGATATALTVERTDRNDPLTLPRVKSICANTDGATLCWNKTSKRAALMVKAPAFMDEDGVPILRVKLLRPMGTEILAASEFSTSHWEEVDDAMFEHLWQAEVDAALNGDIAIRKGDTAKLVIADKSDVCRNFDADTFVFFLRHGRYCKTNSSGKNRCSQKAADGRKHG